MHIYKKPHSISLSLDTPSTYGLNKRQANKSLAEATIAQLGKWRYIRECSGQGHGPWIDAATGYDARATSFTPLRRSVTPEFLKFFGFFILYPCSDVGILEYNY